MNKSQRFCPSVFFYLACMVPTIWFLELYELNERIRLHNMNSTEKIKIITTSPAPLLTTTPHESDYDPWIPTSPPEKEESVDLDFLQLEVGAFYDLFY